MSTLTFNVPYDASATITATAAVTATAQQRNCATGTATTRSVATLGSVVVPTGSSILSGLFCFEDASSGMAALLPVEGWLMSNDFGAFSALESLRRATFDAVTLNALPAVRIRTTLLTAYSTELRTIFKDLLTVPDTVLGVALCQRRRLLEADVLLQRLQPYYGQILVELRTLGVPEPYISLLKTHLTSVSFKNRVAACAAIVLITAIVLSGA